MSKKIIMLFCMFLSVVHSANLFSNGCQSFAYSEWTGKVLLANKKTVPIKLLINAMNGNNGFFTFTGTVNNEQIISQGASGCVEMEPGIVSRIRIMWERGGELESWSFSPNAANPNKIQSISGWLEGNNIEPSKLGTNELIKK